MARKYSGSARSSGYTILVIDDSPDILDSARQLLEAEGHRVLTAPDGPTGLAVLAAQQVELILCDYFMPGMTGEEVVRKVRETNKLVQIILVTGYSGEKPARVMMRELDIQGYHDKSEGAERLLLWVDTALKAYLHVLAMEKHRKGLRYILDITPELHRVQPLDELLQGLLWQIEGLLGAEHCFLATIPPVSAPDNDPEGFVALLGSGEISESLEIRYATGRFSSPAGQPLVGTDRELVEQALQSGTVHIRDGASIVPLMFDRRPLGVIFLDRPRGAERDRELLEVFALQAAAAIQNSYLYDMATMDPLTGACVRAFAVQQLRRAVKRSTRRCEPLSVLMIDLDRFKAINDTYGHQAGDRALTAVGTLLRESVRDTDTVGRYGGDEFLVVLPETPATGARIVAERILERMRTLRLTEGVDIIPIRLSIGISTLALTPEEADLLRGAEDLETAAEGLVASADAALYAAKGTGEPGEGRTLQWADVCTAA